MTLGNGLQTHSQVSVLASTLTLKFGLNTSIIKFSSHCASATSSTSMFHTYCAPMTVIWCDVSICRKVGKNAFIVYVTFGPTQKSQVSTICKIICKPLCMHFVKMLFHSCDLLLVNIPVITTLTGMTFWCSQWHIMNRRSCRWRRRGVNGPKF